MTSVSFSPSSTSPRLFAARAGDIEVFLTSAPEKIADAQRLRHRIFRQQDGVSIASECQDQRDWDQLDAFCHTLVAEDVTTGKIVGTYRLIQEDAAEKAGGFLSATEYDLSPLLSYPGKKLELGRACVDPAYRTGGTIQLLWQVIKSYIQYFDISLLFGIGSFFVMEPEKVQQALAFLHHFYLAPAAYRPVALSHAFVSMDCLSKEDVVPSQALSQLPPLIKGYIKIGGLVGEGAFLDTAFGTLDVCIIGEAQKMAHHFSQLYQSRQRQKASKS